MADRCNSPRDLIPQDPQ